MPGHKSMSKDNISSKIMAIKRLLNKSSVQLCLFSLGFSFFNWFSIPSLFPIRGWTLVSPGHVVTSFQPYLSIIIFRHQHLRPGVWWGLRRPHHPAGASGEHILCPCRLWSPTVVSPLLCETTDCDLNKQTLFCLSVCSQPLCWTQGFSVKNLSQVQEMGGKEVRGRLSEVGKTSSISSSPLFK